MAVFLLSPMSDMQAQSKKEKKSRYYQQSEPNQEFDVKGFFTDNDKNEVDKNPVENEYDVKITRNEADGKYQGEKRVIRQDEVYEQENTSEQARRERKSKEKPGYHTTYGGYKSYQENREKYDKFYGDGPRNVLTETPPPPPPPAPMPPKSAKAPKKAKQNKETEIKMTSNENEYKTTVVKRRYTNLDVLCDDLDLAKVQRPVFKGICSECANDVDLIIGNKTMSSLEKNYQLKTYYMMRDKRLREILDDDQYKKFLRIKDADEYLILTKDPELKDGIHN
jgi:hypothetical protein